MTVSINGVSPRDFHAFMGEVRRVVDNDWDRVERDLVSLTQLEEFDALDRWECFPLSERILLSWDDEEARWSRRPKHISKRKEVK